MKELQKENAKLRQENARLRREGIRLACFLDRCRAIIDETPDNKKLLQELNDYIEGE